MIDQDNNPEEVEEDTKIPEVDNPWPSKPDPFDSDIDIIGEYYPQIKNP